MFSERKPQRPLINTGEAPTMICDLAAGQDGIGVVEETHVGRKASTVGFKQSQLALTARASIIRRAHHPERGSIAKHEPLDTHDELPSHALTGVDRQRLSPIEHARQRACGDAGLSLDVRVTSTTPVVPVTSNRPGEAERDGSWIG
jgi:hypothetical protein